jgi:hypothetical protein
MQLMPTGTAAGCRDKGTGAYHYQRHQPENTLLYRIVERHYPEFTCPPQKFKQPSVASHIHGVIHREQGELQP